MAWAQANRAAAVVVLLGIAGWASAEEETGAGPRVGAYRVVFAERSPHSELTKIAVRLGVKTEASRQRAAEAEYDLARESFEVLVPKTYSGQEAYGLLVWVSPGATVGMPPGWAEVLEKHKLIWVGANNSGNERLPLIRLGLALDAAHNLKARYAIDEKRVYIAGLSGGGRISSMLAVGFPEVFAGGYFIIGCNYYREVFSREQGGIWRKGFNPPPAKVLAEARQGRYVILEGEFDANREQSRVYAEAYKRDGFKQVVYLEVPRMGHVPPNAEWFEKGIAALEGVALSQPSTQPVVVRRSSERTNMGARGAQAALALKSARELAARDPVGGCEALHELALHYADTQEGAMALAEAEKLLDDPRVKKQVEDRREADRLVRVSRVFIANQMYDEARGRLATVLADYAGTPAAAEARNLLEQIKGK